MFILINIALFFTLANTEPLPLSLANGTRRIIGGHEVGDTRPYMVYLRQAESSDSPIDTNWLCGGVIIHEKYILTSAACIENVKQFYVISGTHRWIPPGGEVDECIKYGAKRAVWKCVPKSYVYDGNIFDNIRWMVNDLAVVKVEEDFNFERRIRGCDFIPQKVAYNDVSEEHEKPGTLGSIAGWGSTESFSDVIKGEMINAPNLLEADAVIISKKNCKSHWPERYHYIIDGNMICTKESMEASLGNGCSEDELNCKELVYSDEIEEGQTNRRRYFVDPETLMVHNAGHHDTRRAKHVSGGFCENDHGGPLIVGHGKTSMVVGIIGACQTKQLTNKCYGPYLYTSVWNNRQVIRCAIDKDSSTTCRRLLRASKTQLSETTFKWDNNLRSNTSTTTPTPTTLQNSSSEH